MIISASKGAEGSGGLETIGEFEIEAVYMKRWRWQWF